MPNLAHDPQNPSDLLGRPIQAGDIVAWGTTYGRSPAVCVAEVVKIRFVRKQGYKNVECPQGLAEDYTLSLRAIKSTGHTSLYRKDTGGVVSTYRMEQDGLTWDDVEAKPNTVKLVKNVVKLDLTRDEAYALAYPAADYA